MKIIYNIPIVKRGISGQSGYNAPLSRVIGITKKIAP